MSRSSAAPKIAPDGVHEFLSSLFVDSMHARRALSLGNAVVGAMLRVHTIGKALTTASGLEPKHAIKQVDRLLSNMSLSVRELFPLWVRFLLSQRQDVFAALDWTDFDADGHSVISLNMITSHGRATPLLWKTYEKSKLTRHRRDYNDTTGRHEYRGHRSGGAEGWSSAPELQHEGRGMVNDLYTDARALKRELELQGLAAWAERLEDILSGGSTGTEIVMGIRWLSGELRRIQSLEESTKRLAERIHAAADALLNSRS